MRAYRTMFRDGDELPLRRAFAQGADAYVGGYTKADCKLISAECRAAWCAGFDMQRDREQPRWLLAAYGA